MELPKEIQYKILSMMYKDSDQKSPLARLFKKSDDIELFFTCKRINGMRILRSNNFYLLRGEILKKYHWNDLLFNKHSNGYYSVIGPHTQKKILQGDDQMLNRRIHRCLFSNCLSN